jgi:murein L,D-transpeptidase YcbB/YkuD
MVNWRLAKSLIKLREQLDTAHPHRSRASDGALGDAAHAARKSDHNINSSGVVTAIDITNDPQHGVDGKVLSRQLAQDGRCKYVIFGGKIFKTYKLELGWAKYTGANPHNHHVHISVLGDASKYDDPASWTLTSAPAAPRQRSTLRLGNTGTAVVDLQRALGIEQDGNFGTDTLAEVKRFQREHGLEPDGICGPKCWATLREVGKVT